jgi:hypothetical protein
LPAVSADSTVSNNISTPAEFTERYEAMLRYYGMEGEKIRTGRAHENGDIEQRHHRFKRAVDQEVKGGMGSLGCFVLPFLRF